MSIDRALEQSFIRVTEQAAIAAESAVEGKSWNGMCRIDSRSNTNRHPSANASPVIWWVWSG